MSRKKDLEKLRVLSKGSPIFMAAKYNAGRAQQQRLLFGDGAPVLITMKLAHPWIPFEVLAAGQQVQPISTSCRTSRSTPASGAR